MTHIVKTGDILIISSDGLFDNLYEDEIALIVDNHIKESAAATKQTLTSIETVKTATATAATTTTTTTMTTTTITSIIAQSVRNNCLKNSNDHEQKADAIIKTTSTVNQTKSSNITSDLLNSACELLIQKASKG
jgi:serine/threonine protein phosphatase PrpC